MLHLLRIECMDSSDSVTVWIDQLKHGDADAAQKLWDRYCGQIVRLARKKIQALPRQAVDEDDLANSVFKSLCMGAARDHFSKLNDRDDLWQILFVLTERKAINLRQHGKRQKRDAGPMADGVDMDGLCGREPTPEFAAEVAEECNRLLALLDDDELRFVALKKLEGYTTKEIAQMQGCVSRTVERRVELIRVIWERDRHDPNE
jgi:RNA polymerase sigma factor (sigma-70 family)